MKTISTRLTIFTSFVFVWLVPFFWTGRMGRLPFLLPPRLLTQYACAGLFTKRTWNWNQPLIQVQGAENGAWETVKMVEISPLGAYGYRQRIDRLLLKIGGNRHRSEIRQRLALWVGQRYKLSDALGGEVRMVRFAQNVWPVNCPELAQPEGHWVPNPPDLGPNGRFTVLATFELRDGKATLVTPGKEMPKLPTPRIFARPAQKPQMETEPTKKQ